MAQPNSRDTHIEYCLRRLGEPVIEINVDPDQIEDRVDEALQYYQEYHSDATYRAYFKYQITAEDVVNEYIPIPSNILNVTKVFPIASGLSGNDMFSIKYQMHLNDIWDMNTFIGDLAYYDQIQQYLSVLDTKLVGHPQVQFARRQRRLYIFGDFQDKSLEAGDYIMTEVYFLVDPNSHTSIWNDMWLKEYSTALIKEQWGSNLIKFDGVILPGNVTLNGRQIYEDAQTDIDQLQQRMRDEHEMLPEWFVG